VKPTVVIIGAGSVEFTRELLGDILSFPELGSTRVVLHDIDVERLQTAEAIVRATARAAGVEPEIVATDDRRRALDGANYVITVIAVGVHEATVRDFEIPARYGLNQTIGDTRRKGHPTSFNPMRWSPRTTTTPVGGRCRFSPSMSCRWRRDLLALRLSHGDHLPVCLTNSRTSR